MIFFSLAKRLFRQADGNGGSKSAVPVSCYLNICCDPACTPVTVSSSMSRSLYFVSMPQLRHSWTHPRRRCCPSLRAPWGRLQASRRCSSCRTWSGPRCRTEGDKGAGADLSMDRGDLKWREKRMPKQTGFAAPDAAAISFTSIRIEIWSWPLPPASSRQQRTGSDLSGSMSCRSLAGAVWLWRRDEGGIPQIGGAEPFCLQQMDEQPVQN